MTSKEALLKIESFCAYEDFQEELKAIVRDLEVLELIRKNIYEGGFGFYFKNNLLPYTEDYNKIKEWFHNG